MAVDEVTLPQRSPSARWFAVIPVSLGLAVGSLVLFAWLAEVVLSESVVRSDENIRAFVHQFASPALTDAMRFVTNFGDWQIILCGTVVLLGVLAYLRAFAIHEAGGHHHDRRRHSRRRLERHVSPRSSGCLLHSPADDLLVPQRTRVDLAVLLHPAGRHCVSAVEEVVAAGADLDVATCAIATIGFSRVYLGVHWPSDVLAGYAAALMWMGAVRFVALKLTNGNP